MATEKINYEKFEELFSKKVEAFNKECGINPGDPYYYAHMCGFLRTQLLWLGSGNPTETAERLFLIKRYWYLIPQFNHEEDIDIQISGENVLKFRDKKSAESYQKNFYPEHQLVCKIVEDEEI